MVVTLIWVQLIDSHSTHNSWLLPTLILTQKREAIERFRVRWQQFLSLVKVKFLNSVNSLTSSSFHFITSFSSEVLPVAGKHLQVLSRSGTSLWPPESVSAISTSFIYMKDLFNSLSFLFPSRDDQTLNSFNLNLSPPPRVS